VLLHQSGLQGFGRQTSFDELLDWERVMKMLEYAKPWYEPGTISCYHPQTYGYIMG
jgi:CubicO group peptidase (beta-lactamase class C family)